MLRCASEMAQSTVECNTFSSQLFLKGSWQMFSQKRMTDCLLYFVLTRLSFFPVRRSKWQSYDLSKLCKKGLICTLYDIAYFNLWGNAGHMGSCKRHKLRYMLIYSILTTLKRNQDSLSWSLRSLKTPRKLFHALPNFSPRCFSHLEQYLKLAVDKS